MGLEQVSIIQRVSLIHSVLYERFHCISMGLEQVFIIQRVSLIHRRGSYGTKIIPLIPINILWYCQPM